MNNYIWDNLSFGHKVSRILLIVFFSVSLTMLILGVPLVLAGFLWPDAFDHFDRVAFAVIAGFGIIVYPLSRLWWKIEIREWKWKYLFLGKAFQEPFAELMTHYGAFPEEVKLLKKQCKECYHVNGTLFQHLSYEEWQCRDRDGVTHTLILAEALLEACRSGKGFEEFIDKCDNDAFTEFDRYQNKTVPTEAYSVLGRMNCGVFSDGLGHLFSRVFVLSNFSLYDNGLSAAFTRRMEEVQKKLATVYTPILLSYQKELEEKVDQLKKTAV